MVIVKVHTAPSHAYTQIVTNVMWVLTWNRGRLEPGQRKFLFTYDRPSALCLSDDDAVAAALILIDHPFHGDVVVNTFVEEAPP